MNNESTPRHRDEDDTKNFADQLIAAQRVEPTLRERHEQEIRNMLEQTLTTPRKTAFIASTVVCGVMVVALTIAALSSHRAPLGVRIGVGLGAVYAAGWVFMNVRILRRGSVNRRTDYAKMSSWPWMFMVAVVTLILLMTGRHSDSVRGVWMLLYGLTFLMMASMFLIQHWIRDAKLKTEERLLEVQLRLAELAEEVKRRT